MATTRTPAGDAGTAEAARATAARRGAQARKAPRNRPADRKGPKARTAAAATVPAAEPVATGAAAATASPPGRPAARRRAALKSSGPRAGLPPGAPPPLTLNRAREELDLTYAEFELALQLGEISTVTAGGADRPRVPAAEIARVLDAPGGKAALLSRIELVDTTAAAELLGIGRDRMLRLTKAGCVRPVRWYVNRYRALVWLYLAGEIKELAAGSPALLAGRLPDAVRAAEAEGDDRRARGWRSRRVAQVVRDAAGPWEEAAAWAALLGPEVTDSVVPDPHERSRLRTLRTVLPYGRPGPLADAALIRRLTVADHPDEISLALLALADALHRARTHESPPVPVPGPPPPPAQDAELPVPVLLPDGGAPVKAAAPPLAPAPLLSAAVGALAERPRRSLLRLLGRRPAEGG
ncbi:DUF6397 family protein [Actinacidiphila epipremni]|uniref:DNA-binding protein n=1 Tax=Actinacidiphila epipremni TaxID=2053013 RepID=A0ABX0ZNG3_9ACTN|nr:DUF6397 family protein [Actinacidiphila epipremni]NJP43809.1 hypothetical protein [Actinacidiphila epipremni]